MVYLKNIRSCSGLMSCCSPERTQPSISVTVKACSSCKQWMLGVPDPIDLLCVTFNGVHHVVEIHKLCQAAEKDKYLLPSQLCHAALKGKDPDACSCMYMLAGDHLIAL